MSEDRTLFDRLHPLELKVLQTLLSDKSDGGLEDSQVLTQSGLEPSQLSMAVEWLLAKGLIQVASEQRTSFVSLTPIGEQYLEKHSPLEEVLSALKEAEIQGVGLTIQSLQADKHLEPKEVSTAVGTLKKEGAIQIVAGGYIESTGKGSPTAERLRTVLVELKTARKDMQTFSAPLQELIRKHAIRRGNNHEPFRIEEHCRRQYALTSMGERAANARAQEEEKEEVSQLTAEMLKDGSWRNKSFRQYTINLRAPRIESGQRHPYRAFLDLVKMKLISMGFHEMRGPLVETEFWDMDALFMPQFHPARDIHDVYFVKNPKEAKTIAEPFLTSVGATHEHGGTTGSTGWGYPFDVERARRLVLRSQGTAVSARTLAGQPEVPGKYFSIARCFRYDQVDATHASDFFQVEGIVLGADITFCTLLGLLDLFAREMAQAKESKYLPAYFPFTEPSVELHVRHAQLGWMELGGAGLLRPEVTLPLGVNVPVIAWGLGLDRMAMVALGIHDIRDLFSTDLEMLRTTRVHF